MLRCDLSVNSVPSEWVTVVRHTSVGGTMDVIHGCSRVPKHSTGQRAESPSCRQVGANMGVRSTSSNLSEFVSRNIPGLRYT
jgi:hypothetical protein